MEDNMSIDKKEDMRASSEDIMESTPEAEAEAGPSHPDNPAQPKRKGGRKPVCDKFEVRKRKLRVINVDRSTQPLKNGNNATVKPKPLSENVVPSISSNWKSLSECMRPISIASKQLIEALLMNVSC
jgi:hypothetical protein